MSRSKSFFSSSPSKGPSVPLRRLRIPKLPTIQEHKAEKRKERAQEIIKNTTPEQKEKLGMNLSKSEVKALVKRNEEFLRAQGIE